LRWLTYWFWRYGWNWWLLFPFSFTFFSIPFTNTPLHLARYPFPFAFFHFFITNSPFLWIAIRGSIRLKTLGLSSLLFHQFLCTLQARLLVVGKFWKPSVWRIGKWMSGAGHWDILEQEPLVGLHWGFWLGRTNLFGRHSKTATLVRYGWHKRLLGGMCASVKRRKYQTIILLLLSPTYFLLWLTVNILSLL